MTASSAPQVLPMLSPDGARRLYGLDGDAVFAVPGEAVAYELEGGSLVPRPLRAAAPERPPAGRLSWLPFWRVRFHAQVSGQGAGASAVERVFLEDSGFVRAFSLLNAHYVGDPGLGLTLTGYTSTPVDGPPPVCLGARLPSAEATAIARLYLLEKADRVMDVTGVRVEAVVSSLELFMLPFDRTDHFLHMLVGPGTRFREETLVDLRGIELTLDSIERAMR